MKKYTIHKMEKKLADTEIARYKDFSTVISRYKYVAIWNLLVKALWIGIPAVVVVTISLLILENKNTLTTKEFSSASEGVSTQIFQEEKDLSVLVRPEPSKESAAFIVHQENEDIDQNNTVNNLKNTPLAIGGVEKDLEEEQKPAIVNSFIKASPKIGYDSLYAYLNSKILEIDNSLEKVSGTVIIEFSIDKTGSLKNVSVIQSLSENKDSIALNLIREMPIWNPARLNRHAVDTWLSITVHFKVVENDSEEY